MNAMRSVRFIMMLFVMLRSEAFAESDKCAELLLKYGSLREFIKPKISLPDLEREMLAGKSIKIWIGWGANSNVYLESRTVAQGQPPRLVVVKYMKTDASARENSLLLREYNYWKDKGFLPGFDVSEVLEEGPTWNMFPFFEGKELDSLLPFSGRVPSTRESPELSAIRESYLERLHAVKGKFESAGYPVSEQDWYGPVLEIHEQPGKEWRQWHVTVVRMAPIIQISPANLWVTSDGRFIIFDAF
jgi:hypothetical protein